MTTNPNTTPNPTPDPERPTHAGSPAATPRGDTSHHDGNPASLLVLRAAAALTALGALVQAGIGGSMLTSGPGMAGVHGTIGLITMILAVVAGIAAGLWAKQGGNTGMMWHALTVAVLAVLQYGLGEMGPGMQIAHIVIGLILLVAAIGLVTLAFRKPYAANPHGALNESTHHHEA
ncbi:hypothetical protein [Mariniluteicoccus flavus]